MIYSLSEVHCPEHPSCWPWGPSPGLLRTISFLVVLHGKRARNDQWRGRFAETWPSHGPRNWGSPGSRSGPDRPGVRWPWGYSAVLDRRIIVPSQVDSQHLNKPIFTSLKIYLISLDIFSTYKTILSVCFPFSVSLVGFRAAFTTMVFECLNYSRQSFL